MTELAKMIFEHTGSLILNKKQVAPLIGKSVAFIDQAIHQNRLEKIPMFTKNESGGGIEFHVEDVATFLDFKKQIKSKQIA
ncbi:hypothetical protein Suden_1631 [Sulfurimonas denitrificans DSM 1251]|uniref:Helix-turn-helix domain-containing protein n=1 Tax=Sulfurimonas denitrificans (strain ATCC 33889 / DSM 1251) TaxID=326298 RepID=Q30Q23_SULDN|nr:hypothetical protein [Sulfurimonas denitrificans]ABB44908.1 hypothetical protein Suden_1631 [Sulfurimonas denitrificans DSM 1251]